MNKAKKTKVLSAAAVGGLAIGGFAAAPASAAPNPAPPAPSTAMAHPGITVIPASEAHSPDLPPQLRQAITQAEKQATAKPRGFVPRVPSVNSFGNCSGHVCMYVNGSGLHINSIALGYFSTPGCHRAHLKWASGSFTTGPGTPAPSCYYQNTTAQFGPNNLPTSQYVCGTFFHVSGDACVWVHR